MQKETTMGNTWDTRQGSPYMVWEGGDTKWKQIKGKNSRTENRTTVATEGYKRQNTEDLDKIQVRIYTMNINTIKTKNNSDK